MLKHLRIVALLPLLLCSLQVISAEKAQSQTMTLNLNNADIRAFISTVSEMTGKTFIVDPRVKGNVTVVSAAPVTPDSIYEIFVSVLKVHGYSVVPSGDAIKIIPQANATKDTVPTVSARQTGAGDKVVTRVIQVRHADAAQLVPILRPLLPQHAHLAAHPNSNSLVVADSAANVNRVAEIISRIDQANDLDIEIIPLRHSEATDLATTLNSLTKSVPRKAKAPTTTNTLIADERTNSLIVSGEPSWRSNIRLLIAQLDKEIPNDDNTEVIGLRFADAKALAEVLRGVGEQQLKSEEKKITAKGSSTLGGRFDIQADEATNSLVITAPPFLMRSLKSVVAQLDVRRAQVLIEAIIAELRYNKSVELGVEWQTTLPGSGFGGGISLPLTSASGSTISGYPTTIGSGFSLGFFRGGDLKLLLKAFSGNSDTNILSTPSLVTLDNEEASIHVGQNVPFVTGQYTNDAADATNPFQTIERHDVGVKLKVTPHINEGDTVKLKIEQEISSVDSKSDVEGLVTNKRLIETTILVDNEEVVVLGGLMEDSLTENVTKVPLLGDIPVLGNLFQNRRSALEKKNLMVFLRPQIIRDQQRSNELTEKKYSSIRILQEEAKEKDVPLMPKEEPPVLPAYNSKGENRAEDIFNKLNSQD